MFSAVTDNPPKRFIDVNGDGAVTPLDALVVIHKLNAAQDEKVRIRTEVTDVNGNVVETLSPGQDFQVRVFVKDIRLPENIQGRGVFSAYTDVTFNTSLVIHTIDPAMNGPTADVTYGDEYPSSHRAESQIIATPGELDDIGAIAGFDELGQLSSCCLVHRFGFRLELPALRRSLSIRQIWLEAKCLPSTALRCRSRPKRSNTLATW